MALRRLWRAEQAVTPEMALRLGRLCGNGPEFWVRLQRLRDLWRLERTLAADLARIPTHRAALVSRACSLAAIWYWFLTPFFL
jgi:plasmid maintenance system antidote protein VapI